MTQEPDPSLGQMRHLEGGSNGITPSPCVNLDFRRGDEDGG